MLEAEVQGVLERQQVQSTTIRSVGYDPGSQTLEVEFHHGGTYQYETVPREIYEGLLLASSKGIYFRLHIKDCFPYRRLT